VVKRREAKEKFVVGKSMDANDEMNENIEAAAEGSYFHDVLCTFITNE